MSKTLAWQDIFDLFAKEAHVVEGEFKDDSNVDYYFKGKYNDDKQEWTVTFWLM